MAKIIENDKKFKVISLNKQDAINIGFGLNGTCICMHCGNIIQDEIYYIAVLNDTMDKHCYESWIKGAKRYIEDIPYENNHFTYYAELLNLL